GAAWRWRSGGKAHDPRSGHRQTRRDPGHRRDRRDGRPLAAYDWPIAARRYRDVHGRQTRTALERLFYSPMPGATKGITVPHASTFDGLREVTVSGQLLPKQVVTLDLKTGKRTASQLGDGSYKPSSDGDIHLCLGTKPRQVHIACEVQNTKAWA